MNIPVIIVGAHGVIGRAVTQHLHSQGRETITVARRGPVTSVNGDNIGRHFQVDLTSAPQATTAFAQLEGDVDVVYCAYVDKPTMHEAVAPNMALLRNTLEAIHASPGRLRHLVLIGGGKSYGEHLGGYKTPAKENDPRFLGPIFYNDQEDLVTADASKHGYAWTVLRPDAVIGFSMGSSMNMLTGLAAYGTICRDSGVPLRFPGTKEAWTALHQATDAQIVAAAIDWSLGNPTAIGQMFNVTNGDNFRWCHLWEELAQFFGVPSAPPQPMLLKEQMVDKDAQWNQIVSAHRLVSPPLSQFVSWDFVDGWFNTEDDMVQSTIKIRKAGFTECIDTHKSFIAHLNKLRATRFIS